MCAGFGLPVCHLQGGSLIFFIFSGFSVFVGFSGLGTTNKYFIDSNVCCFCFCSMACCLRSRACCLRSSACCFCICIHNVFNVLYAMFLPFSLAFLVLVLSFEILS